MYEQNERNAEQKNSYGQIILTYLQRRYIIGIICSAGAVVLHMSRSCITYTMDSMVQKKVINITDVEAYCPRRNAKISEKQAIYLGEIDGKYDWSYEEQKLILLSFYIGYLLTHIPMGVISERYGFKWPLFSTVLASGIVTTATPAVFESFGRVGLITMNVLLGATQGGMIPSLSVCIARWYPLHERARFGAHLIGGGILGNALAMVMAESILDKYHSREWVFYTSGILCFVWCCLFATLCYSAPEYHRFISEREKQFLSENITHLVPHSELPPTPWKPMLTSLPVWAYIIVHIGHDFVLYSMLSDLPTYMTMVLNFSHNDVILWSVIPIVLLWITTVSWGFFTDVLQKRGLMNLNDLRKMNTMIASFGPGLFLLFVSYARCRLTLAILFFTLCMCATGPFFSGAKLNAIDLCPNYTGTLMGISDGLGCLGAIAPSVLNVVSQKGSLETWRNAFWLDFLVIASTAVSYLLFGSSKLQKWNMPQKTDDV